MRWRRSGSAIADALFGVTNPGGKLPVTLPRHVGQVPIHHGQHTGNRRGTEVVQLYAADTATGVALPAQQLVGFARLDLEPGASKTVTFVVPMSLLAYTGFPATSSWSPDRWR